MYTAAPAGTSMASTIITMISKHFIGKPSKAHVVLEALTSWNGRNLCSQAAAPSIYCELKVGSSGVFDAVLI